MVTAVNPPHAVVHTMLAKVKGKLTSCWDLDLARYRRAFNRSMTNCSPGLLDKPDWRRKEAHFLSVVDECDGGWGAQP